MSFSIGRPTPANVGAQYLEAIANSSQQKPSAPSPSDIHLPATTTSFSAAAQTHQQSLAKPAAGSLAAGDATDEVDATKFVKALAAPTASASTTATPAGSGRASAAYGAQNNL